ncbi:MAG: hypothetical protein Ct9H300mP1_13130 [Planctomycetaceae bacterium]|nr:MAG: hypothetical protein Ct9H300mP1_13130 [Planctomycetaceae bacterium]
MREESRFDYGKRKDADKKAEQLTAKGKKLFWVQPIKEEIPRTRGPRENE